MARAGRRPAGARRFACARPRSSLQCSSEGLDGLAANFHAELRARLNWPGGAMRPRPVHLNTWEGFYFDVQPEKVKQLATARRRSASNVSCSTTAGSTAAITTAPGSVTGGPMRASFRKVWASLIAHVNALGMEFGLWVEPEMVNPDSDLYRAHPEWALQLAGRPLITARNQLVLDISRAEVADYLFDKICGAARAHRSAT